MIGRIAIAASVIAESLLVYCLAEVFASGYDNHHRAMPALSWIFLGLFAFGLPLAMAYAGLGTRTRLLVTLVASYVAVALVMRIEFAGDVAVWDLQWARDFIENAQTVSRESGPVFMTLMLVIGLWARCAFRAAQDVDLESMPRTLAPSFGIVTALVVIGAMTDRSGEVARGAAVFYGIALLALAFSQLALSGATIGDVRAGGVTGALLGGVAVATVIGVVLFTLIFGLVWPAVGPTFTDVVAAIFTAILYPPAWLLSKVFSFLFSGTSLGELDIQPADIRQEVGEPRGEDDTPAQKVSGYAMRTTALLVVLGAAALAAVVFTAFRRKVAESRVARPESSATGSLGEDLRGLFRNMFHRSSHEDRPMNDGVGRLYREVLSRAEASGRAREPAETPIEFAPVAADRLHTHVVDDITTAFVQARYAGRDPDPALLAELERRWHESHRLEND